MEKLFADLTLVLGLILATWGSVLLGIDALGAVEFVDFPEQGNQWPQQLWFTASINTQLRFIVLALVGFIAITWYWHSWIIGAFGAIFTYVVWRMTYKTLEKLTWFIAKNPPIHYKGDSKLSFIGCLMLPLILVVLLSWAIVAFAIFIVWTILEFGITLPSYYFAEKLIQPQLRKLYSHIAEKMRAEKDRGFRQTALRGMLLLMGGFALQMAGTIALTTSDLHEMLGKSSPSTQAPMFNRDITSKKVKSD